MENALFAAGAGWDEACDFYLQGMCVNANRYVTMHLRVCTNLVQYLKLVCCLAFKPLCLLATDAH